LSEMQVAHFIARSTRRNCSVAFVALPQPRQANSPFARDQLRDDEAGPLATMRADDRERVTAGLHSPSVGASGRSRTCDPRVRSPMLYPLSYGRSRGMEFSALQEPEIEAIAEHEHIPELEAMELGSFLLSTSEGRLRVRGGRFPLRPRRTCAYRRSRRRPSGAV
jgi:hypothetical protein